MNDLIWWAGAVTLTALACAVAFLLGVIARAYWDAAHGLARLLYARKRLEVTPHGVSPWSLVRYWNHIAWNDGIYWQVSNLMVPANPSKPIVTHSQWRHGGSLTG